MDKDPIKEVTDALAGDTFARGTEMMQKVIRLRMLKAFEDERKQRQKTIDKKRKKAAIAKRSRNNNRQSARLKRLARKARRAADNAQRSAGPKALKIVPILQPEY